MFQRTVPWEDIRDDILDLRYKMMKTGVVECWVGVFNGKAVEKVCDDGRLYVKVNTEDGSQFVESQAFRLWVANGIDVFTAGETVKMMEMIRVHQ